MAFRLWNRFGPIYTRIESMRRLFQFGAILMMIGAFYPLIEFFDRWDPPGLSNDTEFAVYALLFTICLVLLLCNLISLNALRFGFVVRILFLRNGKPKPVNGDHRFVFDVPPLLVLPLRI